LIAGLIATRQIRASGDRNQERGPRQRGRQGPTIRIAPDLPLGSAEYDHVNRVGAYHVGPVPETARAERLQPDSSVDFTIPQVSRRPSSAAQLAVDALDDVTVIVAASIAPTDGAREHPDLRWKSTGSVWPRAAPAESAGAALTLVDADALEDRLGDAGPSPRALRIVGTCRTHLDRRCFLARAFARLRHGRARISTLMLTG